MTGLRETPAIAGHRQGSQAKIASRLEGTTATAAARTAAVRAHPRRLGASYRRQAVRTGREVPKGAATVACTQTQPAPVESMLP
jgi:hypothetical protein